MGESWFCVYRFGSFFDSIWCVGGVGHGMALNLLYGCIGLSGLCRCGDNCVYSVDVSMHTYMYTTAGTEGKTALDGAVCSAFSYSGGLISVLSTLYIWGIWHVRVDARFYSADAPFAIFSRPPG